VRSRLGNLKRTSFTQLVRALLLPTHRFSSSHFISVNLFYANMISPIPRPEDYGVSPETGFLPIELPLQCLPHPVYERWERIIKNFQSLLLSKRLRAIVDRLPVIPTSHLETEPEWRRAYSILSFMAHGYIWGGEKPAEVVPQSAYA
jgi:Indoleamine 2,3-dioxygenase